MKLRSLALLIGAWLLFAAMIAVVAAPAQEAPGGVVVQKHYRRFDVTPMPEAGFTLRSEYHLLVGLERTASVMFGGVEGEPAPRQVAVIVGTTEFGEDGTLCFVVDEIQGATPENVMGVRACFVYDKENDTMAPVNDPDGLVMEDCGDDHRLMVQPKPKPESRAT